MLKLVLIPIFFLIFSTYSQAYLGPGIGGGIITATLGILIAIIAALVVGPMTKNFVDKITK